MMLSVLTGDILDSTGLDPDELDALMSELSDATTEIAHWDKAPTGFARRSGDGWQLALGAPHRALRAALYLHARLRRMDGRFETRIAIATDTGTLPPDLDPNSGHGPAFTASGRLLEELSGHVRMGHASGGKDHAALALADFIARGWTQAQARALCEMLPPGAGPRAKAAQRLGITRPAVNQALWAAGFPAIETALSAWEAA